MGSCHYYYLNEQKNSSPSVAITSYQNWGTLFTQLSARPPHYAHSVTATAAFECYVKYDFGSHGGEIMDTSDENGSSNRELLASIDIKKSTWTAVSADLVAKGKVPSTLSKGSTKVGCFNPKYSKLLFKTYSGLSQVSNSLRMRNIKIDISWTDPSLTISTPSSTGGKVTFANNSDTTASYSGNQRYTIPYYGQACSFTLTAVPDSGYVFYHWSDDTANTSATRTLSFTDDNLTSTADVKTYTAVFKKIEVPPEITSASIIYAGKQISAQNKVPAGEGYLISVGVN